jgi:hypothetical protein
MNAATRLSQPGTDAAAWFSDGAGKKASSPGALTQALVAQGLPSSGETKSFAADLLAKIPRAGGAGAARGGASDYKRDERAAAKEVVRHKSYAMLEGDSDEEAAAAAEAPAKRASKVRPRPDK